MFILAIVFVVLRYCSTHSAYSNPNTVTSAIMNNFNCSLCYFSGDSYAEFANHTVRLHRHDPNLMVFCSVKSCQYSTKSWNAYKLHYSRKHKNNLSSTPQQNNDVNLNLNDDNPGDESYSHTETIPPVQPEVESAIFMAHYVLGLEVDHRLTGKAIDSVLSSTTDLVQRQVNEFKRQLRINFERQSLDPAVIDQTPENDQPVFPVQLQSSYQRERFYEQHCGLIQPNEVVLGKRTVVSHGEKFERKSCYGYIVPFVKSLQKLLEIKDISHFVEHDHFSQGEFMYDICDGSFVRNHDIFKRNPKALQIILNTDDIEIVNPIGSHTKKHKLCMFYFTLANVPAIYRSKLSAIQLLAVAKTNDIKMFGIKALLGDFLSCLKELRTGGLEMVINGEVHTVEGDLVLMPCDTLAAQWLGGFKESVSFAHRPCRTCNITNDEMKSKLSYLVIQERDITQHIERCERLDSHMSKGARAYWSREYGINKTSCLLSLGNFNLITVLVHDPMHILLEGIAKHELQLFLHYCTEVERLFSLSWLNDKLQSFKYSYTDIKNKPETIDRSSLHPPGKIKQTAAAMLVLLCTLPFILGGVIPESDENFFNFLRLVQITILSTSPYVTANTANTLGILVHSYLQKFQALYPTAPFIPKMHFLIHLPGQILKFVPLRNQWCMRFEAKHGLFKNFKWKCFKNLPLSVAKKHQKWMCHRQMSVCGVNSGNYVYSGDVVREGLERKLVDLYPDMIDEFVHHESLAGDNITGNDVVIYSTDSVDIHGHHYCKHRVLVLNYLRTPTSPVLVQIVTVIIFKQRKYFIVTKIEIGGFNEQCLAYAVTKTNEKQLVPYDKLQFVWPLDIQQFQGQDYVMLRSGHHSEIS